MPMAEDGAAQSVTAGSAATVLEPEASVVELSRGSSEGCVCLPTTELAPLLSVRLCRLPNDLKLNAISTSVAACA